MLNPNTSQYIKSSAKSRINCHRSDKFSYHNISKKPGAEKRVIQRLTAIEDHKLLNVAVLGYN